jgi:hypothetical protein
VNRNDADPAHDLMPADIAATIPLLYGTERQNNPVAVLKWFTPDANWSWFVVEYSPDERLCFGLVIGQERELGYFSLDEILAVRGPLRLPVERELYFEPTPVSKCK